MATLKQLADEYNQFIRDHSISDVKLVKRFPDKKTAIKRLAKLKHSIADKPKITINNLLEGTEKNIAKEKIISETANKAPKPVHVCRKIFHAMFKANPNFFRKEYINACVCEGINKGTAARQWIPEWKKIKARK